MNANEITVWKPDCACRQGRYDLGPDVKFFAVPSMHSCLAPFLDRPTCYFLSYTLFPFWWCLGWRMQANSDKEDSDRKPKAVCQTACACRQGRYNLDPNVKFFAVPPVHGSLARFVDHPADFCFKLPPSLSYEQGAMVEPLSCGGLALPEVCFCCHPSSHQALF